VIRSGNDEGAAISVENTMRLCLMAFASLLLLSSAQAQSFNCANARTPDEIAICEDGRLSRLDERLSRRFYRLRDSLYGPERARLDYTQSRWLDTRHRCGFDRGCIAATYRARIAELSGG
jgi:uncharacterized protein